MRISDWSSDVCSSDLTRNPAELLQHRGAIVTADTRSKLLATAASIAAQTAYDDLSLSRICSLAQLPVSSFKAEFGDVQASIQASQQELQPHKLGRTSVQERRSPAVVITRVDTAI